MKTPRPSLLSSVRLAPAWHQAGFLPSDRVSIAHQPLMIGEITSAVWRVVS